MEKLCVFKSTFSDHRENVRLQELIGEAWIKIKMSGHGDAF